MSNVDELFTQIVEDHQILCNEFPDLSAVETLQGPPIPMAKSKASQAATSADQQQYPNTLKYLHKYLNAQIHHDMQDFKSFVNIDWLQMTFGRTGSSKPLTQRGSPYRLVADAQFSNLDTDSWVHLPANNEAWMLVSFIPPLYLLFFLLYLILPKLTLNKLLPDHLILHGCGRSLGSILKSRYNFPHSRYILPDFEARIVKDHNNGDEIRWIYIRIAVSYTAPERLQLMM